jgi:hypothetical protein
VLAILLEALADVLPVMVGGALAIVGSLIAEGRKGERERAAWDRTRGAERRLRTEERQRATVEELQDLVYGFHNHIESAALYIVQRGAEASQDEYFRERQRGMLTSQDRSRVLLDRLADRTHAEEIERYFRDVWNLRILQNAAEVVDGEESIGRRLGDVAALLRDTWKRLESGS